MPVNHSSDIWSVTEPEIMTLSGRVDSMTAPEIEEDIRLCIQSGARDMIIDCGRVSFITGTGLQSILRVALEMQLAHGRFALCHLQPQVLDMLELCGADSILTIYHDLAEARAAMVA